MENNFHRRGIDKLPDPTSFQRRNTYNSPNNASPEAPNLYKNKLGYDGEHFKSLDGRKWSTADQSIVANRELYNKMGREINHQTDDPTVFNLTNFLYVNTN